MKRAFIAIGSLAIAGALIAACGGTPAAAPKTSTAAAFPVSVKSGDGTVRIAARPTRILSLSASATEMIYAIGAGHQVVGVDKYSAYPANAPRTKFTGDETSAEDYLPEHPDLVILAYDSNSLVAQLTKLHIPTLLLPPATTIAGADQQIDELGSATGHKPGATATISSITTELTAAARSVGSKTRGKTYYVEIDPTLYTATSKTFIGALFSRLGMVNIADPAGKSSDYPQLSAEYLVKANPDYVFLADTVCCGQTAATFAKRPGFSSLLSVRLGQVVPVNDSLASEWGPHSLETFFSIIAKTVAPDQKTKAG